MTRTFLTIIFSLAISAGYSRTIDFNLLNAINGTKWELVEEKKAGWFQKKNTHPKQETITFSEGSILFDLPDAHYACTYTLHTIKGAFFLLNCSETGQYNYEVIHLYGAQLIMDIKVKSRNGTYVRKKRLTYRRVS